MQAEDLKTWVVNGLSTLSRVRPSSGGATAAD
jgi:hypothetical protein